MNQQTQNSPSTPLDTPPERIGKTEVDLLDGSWLEVSVSGQPGRPVVYMRERHEGHGFELLPDQACDLAEALERAYRSAWAWEKQEIRAGRMSDDGASQVSAVPPVSIFTATVSSSEDIEVTTQNAYGDPKGGQPHVVVLHVENDYRGITLWPREATEFAQVLLEAVAAASAAETNADGAR